MGSLVLHAHLPLSKVMSGLEFRTPFSCLLGTNPFDGLSKMLMKIYRFQDPRNAKSFLGFHRKTKNFAIRLNSLRNWRQPRERNRGQNRERGCRTLICRQGNRCKRQGNRRFQWKSFERCDADELKESREWSWAKRLVWPFLSWHPWRTTCLGSSHRGSLQLSSILASQDYRLCQMRRWWCCCSGYLADHKTWWLYSTCRIFGSTNFQATKIAWQPGLFDYAILKTSSIFFGFHGLIGCAMFSCAPQMKKANRWNKLILSAPVTTAMVSSATIVFAFPNSSRNSCWWNLENNFDKDERLPRRSQYLL